MTKSIKILLIIIPAILLAQCAARKKVTYHIPPGLPKEAREKLVDILDKGQVLYKLYCTDCHGIFTKGKDGIPDFTNQQIDNYSARFMRRDPKNHAVFIKMSPEQLDEVLAFLRYKNPMNTDSAAVKKVN